MEFDKTSIKPIKRGHKKATYDKEAIYEILDACEICHVAFSYEGRSLLQPVNFGRLGDKIYFHGALKNRMTSAIIESGEACVNVMRLDAMKLTRSAFNHSVNYRSATLFGSVREVEDFGEKLIGLKAIINHFVPNRWDHCRPPDESELKATRVIEVSIESASAKIANKPSEDKEGDIDLPYWAGVLPVRQHLGQAQAADNLNPNTQLPSHIIDFIQHQNQD